MLSFRQSIAFLNLPDFRMRWLSISRTPMSHPEFGVFDGGMAGNGMPLAKK
jgi:hypothetical protein